MGNVIGSAADGIAGVLAAPFKSIFEGSCEDLCPGQWDMLCFIEHLCVTNLVKFLMIVGLCYITMMFFYILFKIGLFQCIARSLCKMCWIGCETYWCALGDCTCILWHKLFNTRRVHRRRRQRFRDIEMGYTSGSTSNAFVNYRDPSKGRKRKSTREVRKGHLQSHILSSSRHIGSRRRHRHGRLKTSKVSIQVKGGSRRRRNSKRLRLARTRNRRVRPKFIKRHRMR